MAAFTLPQHEATTLDMLRSPPGNRLERLSGEHKGRYSIRVNNQWRICFIWTARPGGTGAPPRRGNKGARGGAAAAPCANLARQRFAHRPEGPERNRIVGRVAGHWM
ncbi:hypothetical protein E5S69_03685 [Cupriavidus necator]|nr:hypothetical protein [Cupriavidus necator]